MSAFDLWFYYVDLALNKLLEHPTKFDVVKNSELYGNHIIVTAIQLKI
jgi:isocitrate/isopropylmalate dehydrogenase